jgi:hypothetical protein
VRQSPATENVTVNAETVVKVAQSI